MKKVIKTIIILLLIVCIVGCNKEQPKKYLNSLVKTTDITNVVMKSNEKEVIIKNSELSYIYTIIDPFLYSEIVSVSEVGTDSFFDSKLTNGLSFSLYTLLDKYYCKIGSSYYEVLVTDINIIKDLKTLDYYLLDTINEKILYDYNILYPSNNLTCKLIGSYDNLIVCAINDNKSMDVIINTVKFNNINSYHLYTYDIQTRTISDLSESSYSIETLQTIKNDYYLEMLKEYVSYHKYYGTYNANGNLIIVYSILDSNDDNTILGTYEFNTPLYGYYNNETHKLIDLYNNRLLSEVDTNMLYDYYISHNVTLSTFNDIYSVDKNTIKEIIFYNYRLDNSCYYGYYYTNDLNEILLLYNDFINKELLEEKLSETGFSTCVKVITRDSSYIFNTQIYNKELAKAYRFDLEEESNVTCNLFESNKAVVNSDNTYEIEIGNIIFKQCDNPIYDLTSSLTFEAQLFSEVKEFAIIDSRHFRCDNIYYEVIGLSDFSSIMSLKNNDTVVLTIQDKATKICEIVFDKNTRIEVKDIITYLNSLGYKYSYRTFYFDIDLKNEATVLTLTENDTIFIGPITLPWI